MPSPDPAPLLRAAAETLPQAYAPYSGYPVGAAILADDGSVFTGCNLENVSYGLTLCAERNAAAEAVKAGRRQFLAVAVVATGPAIPYPCGACRQVLAEFAGPDCPVFVARTDGLDTPQHLTLGTLLPHSFRLT